MNVKHWIFTFAMAVLALVVIAEQDVFAYVPETELRALLILLTRDTGVLQELRIELRHFDRHGCDGQDATGVLHGFDMRMAFSAAYGKTVSYGEMIRGMLDSLEDTDPGVVEELESMIKKHPNLQNKLSEYRSLAGQDADV